MTTSKECFDDNCEFHALNGPKNFHHKSQSFVKLREKGIFRGSKDSFLSLWLGDKNNNQKINSADNKQACFSKLWFIYCL